MAQAKVSKGGRTSESAKAEKAVPRANITLPKFEEGDAGRIEELINRERDPNIVLYLASGAGHMFVRPPRARYNHLGDEIDGDPGLFLDFQGRDKTRPYNLDNPDDKRQVEELDKWLESGDIRIRRYNIRKLLPAEPVVPFARWDVMNAESIREVMLALLGEDHDSNVVFVKTAAKYEIEVGAKRKEVLAMLDGLLAVEAARGDAFEAAVELSA